MTFPGLSAVSWILLMILVAAARFSSAVPFGFSYNQPKQCSNFTVTWGGGSPPFELLITPRLGLPQRFSLPNSTFDSSSNAGSFSTTLNISSQTIFLMTLSDSAGFGSGGTTAQLTVGSGDSSCATDNRSADFSFQYNATIQQCRDFFLYNYGNAIPPLTVYGLIPQGNSFVLHPPNDSSLYPWDADIAAGTNVMFTLVDSKQRLGGTTDIIPVGYSADSSCLMNSTSPTSTGASGPSGTSTPSHGGSSNGAAIGGGVGGGVAAVLLALGLLFYIIRQRKLRALRDGDPKLASGGKKPAMRRMHNIDLLPERGDRAAQYPLNTHPLVSNENEAPSDYEPVPYVLPPPVTGVSEGLLLEPGPDRGDSESFDAGGSSSARSKAAMANQDRSSSAVPPNAPARFVVHTDAGSVLDEDEEDEEGDAELPPQYTSLGVLITPQRQPSRRQSQRHPRPTPETAVSSTSQLGPSSSHT